MDHPLLVDHTSGPTLPSRVGPYHSSEPRAPQLDRGVGQWVGNMYCFSANLFQPWHYDLDSEWKVWWSDRKSMDWQILTGLYVYNFGIRPRCQCWFKMLEANKHQPSENIILWCLNNVGMICMVLNFPESVESFYLRLKGLWHVHKEMQLHWISFHLNQKKSFWDTEETKIILSFFSLIFP